jgi:outer membrane lipoprotein
MPRLLPHLPYDRLVVRFGLFLLVLSTLSACAPAMSKKVRQEADQSLSFAVLANDPEAYKGKIVIVGGVIAQTTPKSGQTELEIVQKPLESSNLPETTDRSEGRFLVITDSFLDPLIYKKDRKITVAGEVVGSEVRKLNELDYRYPVIKSQELKLWPQTKSGAPVILGIGVGGGWGGPYGYWGWGPGPYYRCR